MPEGLLFVYSDPGSEVPSEEFNDWYDNEHVPLRIRIPGIHSVARWVAVDEKQPTYAATYDLSSPSVISDPAYAALADTRSEREKSILSRAGLLDRRTYELRQPVFTPKTAAYDPVKPGPLICVVEIEIKPEAEDDLNRWYDEEHMDLIAKVPGWVRTRRFVLLDSAAAGPQAKTEKPAKYLAIHEMESLAALGTEELKAATETEWSKRVIAAATSFQIRVFKLQRNWVQE